MPKAPLPPPFSLTLVFLPLFLVLFLFLEVSPSWLRCSAMLCGVSIGAGWKHLYLAWGSPGLFTQRLPSSHPVLTSHHLHQLLHSRSFFPERLEMCRETVSDQGEMLLFKSTLTLADQVLAWRWSAGNWKQLSFPAWLVTSNDGLAFRKVEQLLEPVKPFFCFCCEVPMHRETPGPESTYQHSDLSSGVLLVFWTFWSHFVHFFFLSSSACSTF